MRRIYISTLGCKVNNYESSCVLNEFIENGYEETKYMNSADVIVINTCTVTNRTDYKSRSLITKACLAKKEKPKTKVIVTGCYSQRSKDIINSTWHVDLIVDNNKKNKIYDFVRGNLTTNDISFADNDDFTEFSEMEMGSTGSLSRAFLKVQDGCDFHCSYCVVPLVRGKPRSRPFESVTKQVEMLLSKGYEEIVLSGINLGLYCEDGFDLADLLLELASYDGLKKIRLGSMEPLLFTDKLIDVIGKIDKICPHFHIPLQTGSDRLLKLHGRKYTSAQFKDMIDKLRQIMPNCAFGFDVITGLPGEDEEQFEETFNFLQNMEFTYLHVFVYSKREGTRAARMKNQVHGIIAKERSDKLIELGTDKNKDYIEKLVKDGVLLYTAIENYDKENGIWRGTTDRYVKVGFDLPLASDNLKDQRRNILRLKPVEVREHGLFCEVVD